MILRATRATNKGTNIPILMNFGYVVEHEKILDPHFFVCAYLEI